MNYLAALFRILQTYIQILGKSRYLSVGRDIHIGRSCRLWAPHKISIGNGVYLGKHVHVEANCDIGDYSLIANRVAIVGRRDHDFSAIGFPIRYAPWIASRRFPCAHFSEKAVIESDVWLGYGVIVLTGVTVGRGSVVAAGSVVSKDIPPYSIAAGAPARVVRQRFPDPSDISVHESAIRNGRFRLSERGYDACVIETSSIVDKTFK